MQLYGKDANPIAKATIALIHDTASASSCELFRAKERLRKSGDKSGAIGQIELAEAKIRSVVDMLYKVVRDHPEFPSPEQEPTV